jgi:hypothetical protein
VAAQKGEDRRQALALNARQHENMNRYLLGQAQSNTAWVTQNTAQLNQFRMQEMQRQSAQVAAMSQLPGATAGAAPPPTTMLPLLAAESVTPAQAKPSAQPSSGGTGWPSLLGDPRFAQPRAELEKLLAADQASEAGLTTGQYEEIVAAAVRMKDILRGMAGELNAAEYLLVDDFLKQLMAEYQAKADPTP